MKGFALFCATICVAACLGARPDRNSFLEERVTSVHGLVAQVRTSRIVLDRYERHFGMGRARLLAFVGSLHIERLRKGADFEVYSVPPDGHIKMHHQVLPTGSPVFATRDGTPVLLVKCGNPLFRGPEIVTEHPRVETSPGDPPVPMMDLPIPVESVAECPPMVSIEAPAGPYLPAAPDLLADADVPSLSIPSDGQIAGAVLLPIVGGIWGASGGSGGGGGGVVTRHPSNPTPGPVSWSVFAGPIVLSLLLRRKSKKSRAGS